MNVNEELIRYVEREILPRYDAFDRAHRRDHALTVIAASLRLARYYEVNPDMVYAVAAYHDTGLREGRGRHHEASARIVRGDRNLRRFYPKVYERLVAERRNRDGLEQFKIALSRGVEEGYFQGIVNFDLAITLLRYSVEGLIVRKDVLLSHNMSTNEALVFLVVNFLRGISTEKGMRLIDDFLEKQNGKK